MAKFVLVFLCVLIAYVHANRIQPHCKLSTGQIINVGDEQPQIGTCNIVKCVDVGSMTALTCPEFVVEPPCTRVSGDPKKLYPHCCDSPRCPEKQTN